MKLKASDYPLIANGTPPYWLDDVRDRLSKSNMAEEYWEAWPRLLRCRKYRLLRRSITNHICENKKLQAQLFRLSDQAVMEPCWYIYLGAMFGVVRCAPDLALVVIVQEGYVSAAGGVFMPEGAEAEEWANSDKPYVHYDLHVNNQQTVSAETSAALMALFGTAIPTFMEFAEQETVIVNATTPGKRKATVDGEKYLSELPENVEIIDSSWFRTLVRDGDFGVSGHFRLQPYGPRMQERKLIWIKDFVKHGYHRTAKIGRGENAEGR